MKRSAMFFLLLSMFIWQENALQAQTPIITDAEMGVIPSPRLQTGELWLYVEWKIDVPESWTLIIVEASVAEITGWVDGEPQTAPPKRNNIGYTDQGDYLWYRTLGNVDLDDLPKEYMVRVEAKFATPDGKVRTISAPKILTVEDMPRR